jgi:site-specific DNA recombinase
VASAAARLWVSIISPARQPRRQGSCSNRRSIARPRLEGLILDALRHNLMRPELVEEFVRAFHEETNRARHAAELQVEARRHELSEANRKLDGLIEANADGFRAPGLQTKLDAPESRGVALSQELAEAAAPAPRLHTNLAELYAGQVATLHEALGRSHHARRGTGDHARADRARTGQARRDARQLRGRAGGRDRGDGGTGARREHKKPPKKRRRSRMRSSVR